MIYGGQHIQKIRVFDTVLCGCLGQVTMDFSRGASVSRLFAGMVDDKLVVASNPAKLTPVVSTGFPQVSDEAWASRRVSLV